VHFPDHGHEAKEDQRDAKEKRQNVHFSTTYFFDGVPPGMVRDDSVTRGNSECRMQNSDAKL
jgi:hypothetical protein